MVKENNVQLRFYQNPVNYKQCLPLLLLEIPNPREKWKMAGEIDEKHKQKQKDTAHSDNSSNYLCRRVPIVTRVTPLHEYLLDGHLMKTFISATCLK
uniref:Uncharacterized protein n=1 Tax=Loa loa TaxID=7209 RepID=A0A1I7VJL8_LOALO